MNTGRTIAGEAGPGDDQYLVAGAILNRVASGKFPNSVKSVVTAGQGTGTVILNLKDIVQMLTLMKL